MNIIEKLEHYNQKHLLQFENELNKKDKKALYSQINELNFNYLNELKTKEKSKKVKITPIKALTLKEIEKNKSSYKEIGLKALKEQKIGNLLLAGGMGTRLGSENPKGMYNIGKTKDVYIFQRLIENTLDVVKECGKFIPFFIMTSEKNHTTTVKFFKEHKYFGYNKKYIRFFVQEMAPCCDLNGKVLLESKNKIATSPNGNGGWFNSLLSNTKAKQMLQKYKLQQHYLH